MESVRLWDGLGSGDYGSDSDYDYRHRLPQYGYRLFYVSSSAYGDGYDSGTLSWWGE